MNSVFIVIYRNQQTLIKGRKSSDGPWGVAHFDIICQQCPGRSHPSYQLHAFWAAGSNSGGWRVSFYCFCCCILLYYTRRRNGWWCIPLMGGGAEVPQVHQTFDKQSLNLPLCHIFSYFLSITLSSRTVIPSLEHRHIITIQCWWEVHLGKVLTLSLLKLSHIYQGSKYAQMAYPRLHF